MTRNHISSLSGWRNDESEESRGYVRWMCRTRNEVGFTLFTWVEKNRQITNMNKRKIIKLIYTHNEDNIVMLCLLEHRYNCIDCS